jgi:ParB-like chromosome segregation protein Spo0J
MSKPSKAGAEPQRLSYHEFSKLFPLLVGDEFKQLAADVKAHGLHEPIALFEGKILDGRNRYRACINAKVELKSWEFKGTREEARDYVISRNIMRRHLTAAQKRALIKKLLIANPEQSDRQIAAKIGSAPTTVGTVRKEAEASGDVSKLDTSTDSKGRKQPRHRGAPTESQRQAAAKVSDASAPAVDATATPITSKKKKKPSAAGDGIIPTEQEAEAS